MAGLRQAWTVAAHDLRRRWRSLVLWGVILGALGALYVGLYPTMSTMLEEYMEQAPESMQGYFGEMTGPITIEQWLGMEFLNMFVPVVLPFLVMIMGARAIAGREERKTLDLLLSNPLPRRQVVLGAVLAMAVSLAVVFVMTWVLTYIAVPIAEVDLSPARLAAALAALWPMCLLFGVLSLLLSALIRRSALAIAIPAFILVAMYVLESLAQAVKSVEPYGVISLYHHLGSPIEGDFPWTAVLGMLAGVCVLTGAAVAAFSRRDLFT
ncbi:MAG: ABC transporter permease subunit [Thermoleophilia bacterium]|nr:ABC transporter permease subunit [Thermoleophilia bacterium]